MYIPVTSEVCVVYRAYSQQRVFLHIELLKITHHVYKEAGQREQEENKYEKQTYARTKQIFHLLRPAFL